MPRLTSMDLGASANHERRKLEAVQDAASSYSRARAEMERARDLRDRAIRSAVRAGVPGGRVADAAAISQGLVSRIVNAPPG